MVNNWRAQVSLLDSRHQMLKALGGDGAIRQMPQSKQERDAKHELNVVVHASLTSGLQRALLAIPATLRLVICDSWSPSLPTSPQEHSPTSTGCSDAGTAKSKWKHQFGRLANRMTFPTSPILL